MERGDKRIGSAQLKQGKTVLQQGSMVLYPDPELFMQVFQVPATPEIYLSPLVTLDHIIQALIRAASLCFDATFQLAALSEQEWQEIKQLSPLDYP